MHLASSLSHPKANSDATICRFPAIVESWPPQSVRVFPLPKSVDASYILQSASADVRRKSLHEQSIRELPGGTNWATAAGLFHRRQRKRESAPYTALHTVDEITA